MAVNLFSNRPVACVAKKTIAFADIPEISAATIRIIYRVDFPHMSYKPGRPINAFDLFEESQGYYIWPIQDLDLSDYVVAPLGAMGDITGAEGSVQVNQGGVLTGVDALIWDAATSTFKIAGGLDLSSTTQGLGLPNMTTAQRQAMTNVKAGTVVFDTDIDSLFLFDGTAWQDMEAVSPAWGSITGNLSAQTDLQAELDKKPTIDEVTGLLPVATIPAGGIEKSVQYNKSGKLTGSARFQFDEATQVLTVQNDDGTQAIVIDLNGLGTNLAKISVKGKTNFTIGRDDMNYEMLVFEEGKITVIAGNIILNNPRVAINSQGAVADPSAALDIDTTAFGFLVPRMTTAQRDAIANPAKSLLVYVTTTGAEGFYYNAGTPAAKSWQPLRAVSGGASGSVQFNNNGAFAGATNLTWDEAQSLLKVFGRLAVGTLTPDQSAMVDITTTTKGFLPPRMTLLQRNAIFQPATGLQVFVTDLGGYYINVGAPTSPSWLLMATLTAANKLPDYAIPDKTIQQYRGDVANQVAMLATAGNVGDWVRRTDQGKIWSIIGDPTNIAGWVGGGAYRMSGLDDVTIGTPATNNTLVYQAGGFWAADNRRFAGGSSSGVLFNASSLQQSDNGFLYDNTNKAVVINSAMGLQMGIVFGTNNPTALLAMNSTTKGLLPPQMSTTQRKLIASPSEGLIVYDLTLHQLCVYNGTKWQGITATDLP